MMKHVRQAKRLLLDMGAHDVSYTVNGSGHYTFNFTLDKKACSVALSSSPGEKEDELQFFRQRINRALRNKQ